MNFSKWLALPVVAVLTACGGSDSPESKKINDKQLVEIL